jgi:hypothetical protein
VLRLATAQEYLFFIFEVISLLPCACFLALWKLQAGCSDRCLELLAGGYQSFAGRPASEAAKRSIFLSLFPCACFRAWWELQTGCRDRGLELLAGGNQSFTGRPASEAAKCCGLPPLKNTFFVFEVIFLLPCACFLA